MSDETIRAFLRKSEKEAKERKIRVQRNIANLLRSM